MSAVEWSDHERDLLNRWRFASYSDADEALTEFTRRISDRLDQARAEAAEKALADLAATGCCACCDVAKAERDALRATVAAVEALAEKGPFLTRWIDGTVLVERADLRAALEGKP